jgi:hypothetical protein
MGGAQFIAENLKLFVREGALYADVIVDEHGDPAWVSPVTEPSFRDSCGLPTSFQVYRSQLWQQIRDRNQVANWVTWWRGGRRCEALATV